MLITEKNKKLNIDFNKDNAPDILAWKDIYGSHMQIGNKVYGDFPQVKKVEDYLYEITIDEMDEDYCLNFTDNIAIGACSEARNGNYLCRNYDWTYSNSCEFIVRTLPKSGRYASIGVSSVNVTEQEMAAENYNEKLKLIPYQLLDGVNECGVYCGINVVPAGDKGYTTGTHPGKKRLPNIAVPRFVLDKASTAKEALRLLETRDIFGVYYEGEYIELHMLICDAEDTFIVEFDHNKMVVNSYDNQKAIMTNFYNTGWNGTIASKTLGNTDEEIKATGLTPHAEGLERYLILQDGLDTVNSIDSAMALMDKVKFTKAYDKSMNPFWYSELVGARNLTIYNTKEEYAPVVDIFVDMFNNRDRNHPITWQTVHCSCYDINNKEFKIKVQEGKTVYSYSLDSNLAMKAAPQMTLSQFKKSL